MQTLIDYLEAYFKQLISLTGEMAPYLLLGFLIAGILHVYFRQERIVKYMGSNSLKSVINAALIGIPLPLCSCGVIPTGISFYKNGASKGATTSFLISTPQTGVDSILATYSLLGLPFAILRPVVAFITGIAGGLFNLKFDKNQVQAEKATLDTSEVKGSRITRMLRYAFISFMQDIGNWLLIGLLLAALFAVVIPDDFFTQYIGNEYLSMLLVLAASIPLYVCATGSIPIAAVLMMKGLSPGAALVFLMAGPATNAATITVIGKVLGKKSLIAYLASIVGGALIFGILINHLFPKSLFMGGMLMEHEHGHLLPLWFKHASAIVLVGLLINAFILKKFRRNKTESNINSSNNQNLEVMEFKTLVVKGMTCNHCKANVERNVSGIEGIESVVANPDTNEVVVSGSSINIEQIAETVNGLGYNFEGEKGSNQ